MEYQSQTDEILVKFTLAGDQEAYCELVRRYERAVVASAKQITHNTYSAEDAAQDAFVSAWMKLDTLSDPAKYCGWVCRIAANAAKNMVMRLKAFVSIDDTENGIFLPSPQNVLDEVVAASEAKELYESIGKLPDKVAEVIRLHYLEGLSVAEIAAKMLAPVGTVKYRLHEGRKKLRKELIAVNETIDDTLFTRIKKKLAEFREFRYLHGAANVMLPAVKQAYDSLLRDLAKLPESTEKSSMLAETYQYAFWWLDSEQSDERLAEIKRLAIEGHNEDVMETVVMKEIWKLSGADMLEFTEQTEIPFLEEHGFKKALGYAHFWAGRVSCQEGKTEDGLRHFRSVFDVLKPSDVYYANALSAIRVEEKMLAEGLDYRDNRRILSSCGEKYIRRNGVWRMTEQTGYRTSPIYNPFIENSMFYYWASLCDGWMFLRNHQIGDRITSVDGVVTLTCTEEHAIVETPCGIFMDCVVMECEDTSGPDRLTKTWFKEGVGIVKLEQTDPANLLLSPCFLLRDYTVTGGDGLFPLAKGNRYVYARDNGIRSVTGEIIYEVVYADENTATLSQFSDFTQGECDLTNFTEVALSLRQEYCRHDDEADTEHLQDVSKYLNAMASCAKTPYEKTYAKIAARVMTRIMEGDSEWNPDRTYMGLWNFFQYKKLCQADGRISARMQPYHNFELKEWDAAAADYWLTLNYNFSIEILSTATNGVLWDERWFTERTGEYEFFRYGKKLRTKYEVTNYIDEVSTPAGTFRNCVRLTLEISGNSSYGANYFDGKKEYYFAEGIGLVAMVHLDSEERVCVYHLAEYEGDERGTRNDYSDTGENTVCNGGSRGNSNNYMPIAEGMRRKYVPAGLPEEYEAYIEYFIERRGDETLVMLTDQCGIRKITT